MIYDILQRFAAGQPCPGGDFLGFPKWHKYLPGVNDPVSGLCSPQLAKLNDFWLIGAAILELMIRIAALLAVIIVVYGGIRYITSQGNPDQVQQAKNTIVNALIGLVIAIAATAIVSFIAGRFFSA